ncbi:hypothetical protein ABT234_01830 [Streptomyces sp. NPDC001586]|uniref:hypothetical protein n=1 Tax=unclassified Streptomyces TaxID=2593676 RepID=UPI00331BABFF
MAQVHDHSEGQDVIQALRAVLPIPSRTRVYMLACGCPDAEGCLSWYIDTETRSYELEIALAGARLRHVQVTSRPLVGAGTTWSEDFLVPGTPADWAQSLARLVARLTLSDRSPFSLD